MVDNGAGDDVEPKPVKKEASGDVKPIVNVNYFESKFHFKLALVKLKNLNWYLSVLFAKVATPPHILQQMKDGESDKSYLIGFVNKGQGRDLVFV